jgi:hypothetical protein
MATRIKMSDIERRILDRVLLSPDGFERIEDLLAAIDTDRNQFVDALESLEGEGYLSVSNLGGSIIVACDDPLSAILANAKSSSFAVTSRVGQC